MIKVQLLFLSLFIFISASAQNQYESFWNTLLKNNRKEASEILKKEKKKNTIEYKMTEAILETENGQLKTNTTFLPNILENENSENYIYAFWNETYVFGNYIESGFDKGKLENISYLNNQHLENPIVNSAVHYISGIAERYKNNWNNYQSEMIKVNAIRDWKFCGPFENLNNSGIDYSYPPENSTKSETGYDAISNGILNWYSPKTVSEPYCFFVNHDEYGYGVNYAQTFLNSSENKNVQLRIGKSSKIKIWLNDVLIFDDNNDVITDIDAFIVEINIPKGNNRLLLKTADGNGVSYFSVRITDKAGNPIPDININSEPKAYNKSTISDLSPQIVTNSLEAFFVEKVKSNPNQFLYQYALASTYLRNGKYQEAKKIINPWYKKHPQSSLLRKIMINIYVKEENYTQINDIKKNIDINDPDYYFNLVIKCTEVEKIQKMTIDELKAFRKRISDNLDYDLLLYVLDFNIIAKELDEKGLKNNLDKIIKLGENDEWMNTVSKFAMFYSSIFKDDKRTKEILEKNVDKWFYFPLNQSLYNIYDKQGESKKALKIYTDLIEKMPDDNTTLLKTARYLYSKSKYKEALIYVEKGLENYPYSFVAIELKADILVQTNKKKEALILYKKALRHNSNNSSLRTKIKNLSNTKNILTSHKEPNIYEYVKKNRGKETVNNYGYNILLNENVTEIQSEGGSKIESTYLYEITSQTGIDIFKEYDMSLGGRYQVLKSEIIKKDGSISPADKNGTKLVFKGLEKGDIIYLNSEQNFSGSGRFYKDFVDYISFDSYHPTLKKTYKLLVPEGIKINYKAVNGDINLETTKEKEWTVYNWTENNVQNKNMYEDYMPIETDVFRYLHISTINSWNDIANWYSDLVSSQFISNPVVEETFNEIFKDGIEGLSDDEKASKIYYYLTNHINYSSVNFRQSGFIPQKPSKTIETKLGDCKDLSTLFVILAEKAKLKANLVLVLTSENGEKALVLPSQQFNHCIVKTQINGQDQYLELTDKDLPFKALPNGLINALILEIPLKQIKGQTKTLKNLTLPLRTANQFNNIISIDVDKESQKLTIETSSQGSLNSYYTQVFKEPNYEVKKKKITQDIKDRIGLNLSLDSLYAIDNQLNQPTVSFKTDLTIDEKVNKIGSTYIYKLPLLSRVVTGYIINKTDRKYPIDYVQYENCDEYNTTYIINLKENETFTEVPENLDISFKKHSYKITYAKLKSNQLEVNVEAKTDLSRIEPNEYLAFKKYVKQILEAEESLIGFK